VLIAMTLAATLVTQSLRGGSSPAPDAPPPPPREAAPGDRPDPRLDLDANKDGTVTRDEFLAPQIAAFAVLDANGDGRISPEEFVAGRAVARVILDGDHGPGERRQGGAGPQRDPGLRP
jgi:4'-phosphopantetheinyl transferase EntD